MRAIETENINRETCPYAAGPCAPAYDPVTGLRQAVHLACRCGLAAQFSASGFAKVPDCSKECILAFHAKADRIYVAGDVDPRDDISSIISYSGANEPSMPLSKRPSVFLVDDQPGAHD